MYLQSPQSDLPRGLSGGADVWDRPQASAILLDEYFDQITAVTLAGNNAAQPNTSTSAGVVQTQVLLGAPVSQATLSTSGAIAQTHALTGASVAQINTSTSGSVGQSIVLTGQNVACANTCTSGAINTSQTLLGADCAQVNESTSGAIFNALASPDRTLKISRSVRLAMIASDSRIMRVKRDNRVLQA